jgi:hypothetical protein
MARSEPSPGLRLPRGCLSRSAVYRHHQLSTLRRPHLNGGGGFSLILHPESPSSSPAPTPSTRSLCSRAPTMTSSSIGALASSRRMNSISARYVSAEMPGYDELDAAGDWQPQSDYGPIWFPHVKAGWAPYHFGHWVNMPFYGWTWVADEPWGAAPFHYGRWVVVGGRWGWIPGPREGHPVWSPAQVVFAGGISGWRRRRLRLVPARSLEKPTNPGTPAARSTSTRSTSPTFMSRASFTYRPTTSTS